MGVLFSLLVKKLKMLSEDIQNRIADWAVTYTLAIFAFINAEPSTTASEEYIIIFKSVAAIITGAVLTVIKLVIEHIYQNFFKKNKNENI